MIKNEKEREKIKNEIDRNNKNVKKTKKKDIVINLEKTIC